MGCRIADITTKIDSSRQNCKTVRAVNKIFFTEKAENREGAKEQHQPALRERK
jgi:hypothetical protein